MPLAQIRNSAIQSWKNQEYDLGLVGIGQYKDFELDFKSNTIIRQIILTSTLVGAFAIEIYDHSNMDISEQVWKGDSFGEIQISQVMEIGYNNKTGNNKIYIRIINKSFNDMNFKLKICILE